MKPCGLSLIIPVYLEEENMRILLPRLQRTLKSLGISFEINVVDTLKPMDNVKNVCLTSGANYINREGADYYGNAVRTGIRHARGEYIIFMDGDGSHTPEFIGELLKFRQDYDVVIASRYIKGGFTDNSKILIFLSRIVNFFYTKVLQLECQDVSNSFKLYRTQMLKELHLSLNNFDIIEEVLYKLKKKYRNLKIKEVPYTFKKRMFGHTKRNLFVYALSYLFSLIKLRWQK